MANPVLIDCPKGEWTLVATNMQVGFVHVHDTKARYFQTYRETGGVAPVGDETEGVLFNPFGLEVKEAAGVDIYIFAQVQNGRVRVDQIDNQFTFLDQSVNTHDAHVHHDMWNHFAFRNTGDSTTIAVAVNKGDYEIEVADATGFTIGKYIDLHRGTLHSHIFHKITAIAGDILTLNWRVDNDHEIGDIVNEVDFNMAPFVGTMASPVIFEMPASEGETIHINRFLITMVHKSAGDLSKFGSRVALLNGLHMRVNRNDGEEFETQTIWQANKDLKDDMYNVEFTDKSGGGNFGTSGRWTYTESDVVIRLDGNNNDKVEYLIQDDMTLATELIDLQIKGQAHYEQGGRD